MQIGLILAALAFPLLELAVLIKVGQSIGFWWTVLLLAVTGVAGGLMVHAQGMSAARRAMEAMNEGRAPIGPVVDSMMIMLAGVLLMIPGLLTDVMGLLLLIPPVRTWLARWGAARMAAGGNVHVETQWRSPGRSDQTESEPEVGRSAPRPGQAPVVIDGEWERIEPPKDAGKPGPDGGSRDR